MKNMIIRQDSSNFMGMASCLAYTLFCRTSDRDTVSYGVTIKNEITGEIGTVADITENPQTAERLFDLLLTGCVTPVSLKDVVEDFIVEN